VKFNLEDYICIKTAYMKHIYLILLIGTFFSGCKESKVEKIKNYVQLDSTFNIQLKHYYKSLKDGNIDEMKKYFYQDYFICLKKDFPSLTEIPDSIYISIFNEFNVFSKQKNISVNYYCGKIKRRLIYEKKIVYEFDSVLEAKSDKKHKFYTSNSFSFSDDNGKSWTFLPGDNEEVLCILENSLPSQLKEVLLDTISINKNVK